MRTRIIVVLICATVNSGSAASADPPGGQSEWKAQKKEWEARGVVLNRDVGSEHGDVPASFSVRVLPDEKRWNRLHSSRMAGKSPTNPEILLRRTLKPGVIESVKDLGVTILHGPQNYTNRPLGPSEAGTLIVLQDADSLILDFTEFGDPELLLLLPRFPKLKYLSLDGTTTAGDGLRAFKHCPLLVDLILSDTTVTDQSLHQLAGLNQLTSLALGGTRVTGTDLTVIAKLPKLQTLHAHQSRFSDAGVTVISESRSITKLDLAESRVTNAGMEPLRSMPQLRSLDLGGLKAIDDRAIDAIVHLSNLEVLYLDGTSVTGDGAGRLGSLPKLRVVFLQNTAINDAAIEKLRLGFPSVAWIGGDQPLTAAMSPGPDENDIRNLWPTRGSNE